MKKEDLVIGRKYGRSGKRFAQLVGIDIDGDPILKPLDDRTVDFYDLYTEQDKKQEPSIEVGCFGMSMGIFCEFWNLENWK